MQPLHRRIRNFRPETLSIPFGMQPTIPVHQGRRQKRLSIPFGMQPENETKYIVYTLSFFHFQSLLGCNPITVIPLIPELSILSIPFGMQPLYMQMDVMCFRVTFNPFWDATVTSTTNGTTIGRNFQSLLGCNLSPRFCDVDIVHHFQSLLGCNH